MHQPFTFCWGVLHPRRKPSLQQTIMLHKSQLGITVNPSSCELHRDRNRLGVVALWPERFQLSTFVRGNESLPIGPPVHSLRANVCTTVMLLSTLHSIADEGERLLSGLDLKVGPPVQ